MYDADDKPICFKHVEGNCNDSNCKWSHKPAIAPHEGQVAEVNRSEDETEGVSDPESSSSPTNFEGGWRSWSPAACSLVDDELSDDDESPHAYVADGGESLSIEIGTYVRVTCLRAPTHSGGYLYGRVTKSTADRTQMKTSDGEVVEAPTNQFEYHSDEAHVTEYAYTMRAILDSGATSIFLPHPHFCVEGSILAITGNENSVTGMAKGGKALRATHTGTLRMYSNVPGCSDIITLENCLIVPGMNRALIGGSVLDDMGYYFDHGGGQCRVRFGRNGPSVLVLPRMRERKGKLVDLDDIYGTTSEL